jgi:hypothetical protein
MTIIWPGKPGERFENDTGRIVYQWFCSWHEMAGACAQYHLQVAEWWSPLLLNCTCCSKPIHPGTESEPYEDWRRIVARLPADQRYGLVGEANWRLLLARVVKWRDVVTSTRVRDLEEVVSIKNLTVDQMIKAGVDAQTAETAFAAVNTREHIEVARQRAGLIKRLAPIQADRRGLADLLAGKLVELMGLGSKPSGGL